MSKSNTCKIYYDSEYVSWTIPKECIEETLLGTSKKPGLLFLKVESAGEVEFKDSSCKINTKNEKLCNKTMTSSLKFKNGKNDSVMTPLAVVNFHTHPLSCYIDAQTIWGWPSGEDLGQCLNFARDNNLTHIIFAIEGTYVIDINKVFLHYIQTNKKLFTLIRNNIQEIFKLTHKHRMYFNDSNKNVSLDDEFYEIFMKPLGMSKKENILLSWIYLVNNLTLEKLIILSNQFNVYFNGIKKIPLREIDSRYLNLKIYSIAFFKNITDQWNLNLSKKEIFNILNQHKKNLEIKLPNKITYSAPFISEDCKLTKY
jgi:hypothetical protein